MPLLEIEHRRLWIQAILALFAVCCLLMLICQLAFVRVLFRRGEKSMGIVLVAMSILCCPGFPMGMALGLGYGWAKARSWQISQLMWVWTLIIISAVLTLCAFIFVRFYTEESIGPLY